MAPTPQTDSERVLDEARTLKDMAERVLANGPEPAYATEKLRRAHAASVRALIHGLQTDPQALIDTIAKERAQRTIRQHEARWRWGSCPRCDADAWIVTPDADSDAEARAAGFLEGATSAGDIAGRTLTLIALASLANEQDTAFSRQSHYELTFGGPWAAQAKRDLNAIVRERIKEGQLPALDAILSERIANDEQAVAREQEIASASARLQDVNGRLSELDEKELDQALSDAVLAWGEYHPKTRELRTQINTVRGQRAAAQAGEHVGEQAEVAA
jgi:hypothetical protein